MKGKKGKSKPRVVIGTHACVESLRIRGGDVKALWIQEGKSESRPEVQKIFDLARQHKVRVQERPKNFFQRFGEHHQGVALEVTSKPEWDEAEANNSSPYIIVALDEVTDPHNLGAILRSAWLLGAKALLISERRSVDLSPAVCKVASGGAEHLPVVSCHLPQTLEALKKQEFWIYGLDQEKAQPLWAVDFPSKVVLVVGSEDKGLRQTVRSACDDFLAIPQVDQGASLNASVATAVSLAEVVRQQQKSLKIQ